MSVQVKDPYYKVDELIKEMMERAGVTTEELRDQFRGMLGGMLAQFTTLKKQYPHLDLRHVRFENPTWRSDDGLFVVGITYRGAKLTPRHMRWD